MKHSSFEGVVIKKSNYSEADKIVTIFTKEFGKITVLAKGLRRMSSKRSGSLDLFTHIKGSHVAGRGNLPTLTEVVLINMHANWKKHFGRISVAYRLAEVVDKLTADFQPHPETYDLFLSHLSDISHLKKDWQVKLDIWIIELLNSLGYLDLKSPVNLDLQDFIEDLADRPLKSFSLLR